MTHDPAHVCTEASWQVAAQSSTDSTWELRCLSCGYVFSSAHHTYTGTPEQDAGIDELVGVVLKMRRGDEHDHDLPIVWSDRARAEWWNTERWAMAEQRRWPT